MIRCDHGRWSAILLTLLATIATLVEANPVEAGSGNTGRQPLRILAVGDS